MLSNDFQKKRWIPQDLSMTTETLEQRVMGFEGNERPGSTDAGRAFRPRDQCFKQSPRLERPSLLHSPLASCYLKPRKTHCSFLRHWWEEKQATANARTGPKQRSGVKKIVLKFVGEKVPEEKKKNQRISPIVTNQTKPQPGEERRRQRLSRDRGGSPHKPGLSVPLPNASLSKYF